MSYLHMLIFHSHKPDTRWIRALLLLHGMCVEHNSRETHDLLIGLLVASCNPSYKKQTRALSAVIKEFNVIKAKASLT